MKSSSYYLNKNGYKTSFNKLNNPSDNILSRIGLKLTIDNNYDIDNKKTTNVADPQDHKDAVNKEYIDLGWTRKTTNLLTSIDTIINDKIQYVLDYMNPDFMKISIS
jgi:hypothetical protein